MSSLLSQATEYNSGDNSTKINRQRQHAKTIKKHNDTRGKQKNIETLMKLSSISDDEDDTGLADFKPMKPQLTRTPHNYQLPEEAEENGKKQEDETDSQQNNSYSQNQATMIPNSEMPSLNVINRAASQFNQKAYSQPSTLNDAYSPSQNLQESLNNVQNGNYNAGAGAGFGSGYSPVGSMSNINEQLNHIIHLLEEQQNSKTSTTTEELILYTFLGVFTIYIVDSFTKVGKAYTR